MFAPVLRRRYFAMKKPCQGSRTRRITRAHEEKRKKKVEKGGDQKKRTRKTRPRRRRSGSNLARPRSFDYAASELLDQFALLARPTKKHSHAQNTGISESGPKRSAIVR
jgi:hypothetical protein